MGFLDKIMPPGKMNIQLEKLEFHPGDTVNGTVLLEMKKPMQARALKAKVISEETVRQRSGGSTTTKTNTLFEFEKELSGEREYRTEQHPFQITIPRNTLDRDNAPQLEGAAADAVALVKMFAGSNSSRQVEWRVEAKLDISGGRDISKKIKINVV